MRNISNKKIKIFIITHKDFMLATKFDYYIPLLVGAEKKIELKKKFVGDDTGINISGLNEAYCELTGLYWIWKNENAEIVGLVHYRRYFIKGKHFRIGGRYYSLFPNSYTILDKATIYNILNNVDIIVKVSRNYRKTIKEIFVAHSRIGKEKWDRFCKVFFVKYPTYKDDFIEMQNGHKLFNCNMFIGKKDIIDEYCQWLFDFLFSLDEKNRLETGINFNNREMGYFGEFLFGIWLRHNNIKYRIVDVINIGEFESEDSMISVWRIIPNIIIKVKKIFVRN